MKGIYRDSDAELSSADFILNDRGAIYHLDLAPGELSETIILVGDPGRVDTVASKFDVIELTREHREFKTITGTLKGNRISVLSTGIGVDNIDIVINEVDALFNVDFQSKRIKPNHTDVRFIRLGTSGCMQPDIEIGELVVSKYAVGYDGVPYHYRCEFDPNEAKLATELMNRVNWDERLADLYAVESGPTLFALLNDLGNSGITVTSNGFYGPQNRQIRLQPSQMHLFDDYTRFEFDGYRILNFEMETSGLYAMASLLGHEAITLCALLANRANGTFSSDPSEAVNAMIDAVLERLTR